MPEPLAAALLDKILEQIERTEHLIEALPADSLHWTPPVKQPWTTARLLEHLVRCVEGFCAVLYAVEPERLAHFQQLRSWRPEPELAPDCIGARLRELAEYIAAGFDLIEDTTLAKPIPTVFVADGEPAITLLLGNLEHLINHKHQLFMYLRLMHVDAGSRDLYRFRDCSSSP